MKAGVVDHAVGTMRESVAREMQLHNSLDSILTDWLCFLFLQFLLEDMDWVRGLSGVMV